MLKRIKQYFVSATIGIVFAFKRFDDELKADPIDLFKTEQRAEMRSLFNMFDEQYVAYFYEVLKKADKFLRSANPAKIQRTAGKFGMNYGMKDKYGRRYEHYGFFDEKHRFHGKSINEVREIEVNERTLNDDDDYPVIIMYQNKKEFSFSESLDIVLNHQSAGLYAPEIHELARMKKYPLTIVRKNQVVNRIEQLTEFLHVKQVTEQHKILEFFIPKKFKLEEITDDDPIFQELISIDQVWFKDEYGDRNSYKITKYHKRGEYKKYTEKGELNPNGFDIIKFTATDIVELK